MQGKGEARKRPKLPTARPVFKNALCPPPSSDVLSDRYDNLRCSLRSVFDVFSTHPRWISIFFLHRSETNHVFVPLSRIGSLAT